MNRLPQETQLNLVENFSQGMRATGHSNAKEASRSAVAHGGAAGYGGEYGGSRDGGGYWNAYPPQDGYYGGGGYYDSGRNPYGGGYSVPQVGYTSDPYAY